MQANHKNGKILIVELEGRIFSILHCQNQILSIHVENVLLNPEACRIGNLYVGKIRNISTNIGAAFVEVKKGFLTFLPLKEAKDAIVTNRKADGKLKPGDELLVQIVREPAKTKIAGVSAKLSLSGAYVVIEYGQRGGIRISSKLGTKYHHIYENIEPLQEIAKRFSLIIRTNAANVEDVTDVVQEAEKLAGQMEKILQIGDKRTCYSCLYQSEPEYVTFIRNCYQSEYDEIITDQKEIYEKLCGLADWKDIPIRYYEDDRLPLYKLYSIETRIQELRGKKVWLKSGAYLVIEQTEALIAIDVNTGKYESRKAQEETYLKINLEAAEAIAIALRARNLSGMILVDFINMKEKGHYEQLMEYMKKLLKKDSVPSYVVDITGLGLMEITRQKKNKSFAEQMQNCLLALQ